MSETTEQRFVYVPISALLFSVTLHITCGVLLVAFHVTGFLGLQSLQSKKKIYQDYIQVDVVALPDELASKAPSVDVSQPTIDTQPIKGIRPPAQPDLMVLPQEKAQEVLAKEALKKRQAEQEKAIKELEEEANREKALKALVLARSGGRLPLKGNIVAQGNARAGEMGTSKDIYNARVRAAIKEHFNIYSWQKKKELVTVVHLNLFPSGRVRKKKIMSSSNDRLYDAAVLQAIDQAQPLPVPADLSLIANGITVEFKPTE